MKYMNIMHFGRFTYLLCVHLLVYYHNVKYSVVDWHVNNRIRYFLIRNFKSTFSTYKQNTNSFLVWEFSKSSVNLKVMSLFKYISFIKTILS